MRRWQVATALGVGIPLVFPGIPILGFFVTANRRAWNSVAWTMVLIPNVLLVIVIGCISAAIYLVLTRKPAPPTDTN